MTGTTTAPRPPATTDRRGPGERFRAGDHPLNRVAGSVPGLVTKLLLLGAVDAVAIAMVLRMVALEAPWYGIAVTVVATLALNLVYLGRRNLPLKYLVPGTLFLLIFQVYPFVFTFYIAATNYSTGQILTKPQAIERIESLSVRALPDAPRFDATAFADGDELGLLLRDPAGERELFGTADGLAELDGLDVVAEDDRVVQVDGFSRLNLGQAQDRQAELAELRVPFDGGEIQLTSLSAASVLEQTRTYDPDTDTITDTTTGTVYRPSERGRFVDADGQAITPGWRVVVGSENLVAVLTNEAIRGPFGRVLVWTYAFAFLSTLGTFVLGLALALTVQDQRVRGRRTFRLAMIIPYALPTFMTALIWRGMMNRSFGVLNEVLNTSIPWLNDPNWARFSVVLVNLWFGFPYMFLICTAALQAIPEDVYEAASLDGANAWQRLRSITMPLLLVATAPVLVATFAFNFNNFNVIYLLSGGNPPIAGATTPAGHTDILISYTYRIAFESGGGQNYALGATVAVLTFVLVAIMAAVSFRWIRPLEEVNG